MAAPTSKLHEEYYGAQWLAKNSITDTVIFQQMFNQVGDGIKILDFLEAAGRRMDVYDDTVTHIERYAPERPIKIKTAIAAGAAGAPITVVLHADNYDTNSRSPVRVGDDIVIPAAYLATAQKLPQSYRVMSRATATLTYDTLTCEPYSESGTYNTQVQITDEIPALSWLMIGSNSFSDGSGQPTGTTEDFTTRTHAARLMKETVGFEGGILAKPYYEVTGLNGEKGIISEASIRAEFLLDAKIDKYICFGERTDNTALVETSDITGASNSIQSGDGIYTHAANLAASKTYDDEITYDDFYDYKLLFESTGNNGVVSSATMFVGPDLYVQIDKTCRDFIREYSGGSDLIDKASKRLGVTMKTLHVAGIDYIIQEVASFSNASTYGLNVSNSYIYEFPFMGLTIPNTSMYVAKAPNGKTNVSMPNVTLGYVNKNGTEER